MELSRYTNRLSASAINGWPERAWKRLDHLSKDRGFTKLGMVFSFDCDTDEDANVVLDLDKTLRHMGLNPAYAVPGQLLENHAPTYIELSKRGASFLNHGYTTHTFWNTQNNRYESCFFYDQLPPEKIREDIRKGHDTVTKILGQAPIGFRTPHFGTFQGRKHFEILYSELRQLGYKFSSSTVPQVAFQKGPAFDVIGITEIPVSGTFLAPTLIQDTWAYFKAPDRIWNEADYSDQARKFAQFASENQLSGLINLYGDPSHVWDKTEFLEGLKAFLSVSVPVDFETVLNPSSILYSCKRTAVYYLPPVRYLGAGRLERATEAKRNPRNANYMKLLLTQRFGDGIQILSPNHFSRNDLKKNDEIILLWPDGNGLGWFFKEACLWVWGINRISILNGRNRYFRLHFLTWVKLCIKRNFERFWIGEIGFSLIFLLITPFLLVRDMNRGSRIGH